jgi:phosphoribosylanthranilate isomerase
MIYYLITPFKNNQKNEIQLIKSLCKFEGIQLHENDDIEYIKKYYKGGRPAIVIKTDFIDVESSSLPTVVFGFWQFVDYLRSSGCIQC